MAYQLALEALGDPTRRSIFELLRTGAASVGQLAAQLPVSRPAVSQHLRVLKGAGLVRDRRDGNRRLYEVDRAGLAELRDFIDGFWDDVLSAFTEAANQEEQEEEERRRGDASD